MIRAYHIVYAILRPFAALLYPMKYTGRENVPDGPAIVCANHSNYIDPILIAFACGWKHFLHFMAKAELMRAPLLGWILHRVGAFGVERGKSDIKSIRTAMKYLKAGEKIMIFPEGTRADSDDEQAAKSGAVRLAAKLKVPIVPVYVPRRKKIFGFVRIAIGSPYTVEEAEHGDYGPLSDQLMEKIYELRTDAV